MRSSVYPWLFFCALLTSGAYFFMERSGKETTVSAPSSSAGRDAVASRPIPSSAAPALSNDPWDWPEIHVLDEVEGTWMSEQGDTLTVDSPSKKKHKRDWSFKITRPRVAAQTDGSSGTLTCDVFPDSHGRGYSGTCTGYGLYEDKENTLQLRLKLNADKTLYFGCLLFDLVLHRKD